MTSFNHRNTEDDLAEHLLITYATRRPYRNTPSIPNGAEYNVERGYWIQGDTALIQTEGLKGTTKKCDQETGEDQKGE